MAPIIPMRMSAAIEGDFVVFLIGMRINRPWKVHLWLPPALTMMRMLRELERNPQSGFLGAVMGLPVIVQYWRSFAHLEAYARNPDGQHWPAWAAFNRRVREGRGELGVWHETYLIRHGEYEAVYSGMPPFGLGAAGGLKPFDRAKPSARQRMRVDQTGS